MGCRISALFIILCGLYLGYSAYTAWSATNELEHSQKSQQASLAQIKSSLKQSPEELQKIIDSAEAFDVLNKESVTPIEFLKRISQLNWREFRLKSLEWGMGDIKKEGAAAKPAAATPPPLPPRRQAFQIPPHLPYPALK